MQVLRSLQSCAKQVEANADLYASWPDQVHNATQALSMLHPAQPAMQQRARHSSWDGVVANATPGLAHPELERLPLPGSGTVWHGRVPSPAGSACFCSPPLSFSSWKSKDKEETYVPQAGHPVQRGKWNTHDTPLMDQLFSF
jgi:hypothetical protein